MNLTTLSRRRFLATASLVVPAGWVAAAETAFTNRAIARPAGTPSSAGYFGKGERLTISMWDFSWLIASHPGGAYEDLERRVAEARERGYNTLRVDCFPSRVLEAESRFEKNWDPAADLPQWGQCATSFACNVRSKVAQLAMLCRKHGLWLGLDSWDKGHMFTGKPGHLNGDGNKIAAVDEEREFTRYAQTWVKALKLMREDGVLERAVWIAPMNEVPHFGGRHLGALAELRSQPQNEGETRFMKIAREDAVYRRVNHWMAEPIQAEVAREKIPLSYSSLGAEDYAARLTDAYDVVDVHFMPDVITDDEDRRNLANAAKGGAGFANFAALKRYDLKAYSQAWERACRKHYAAMLKRAGDFHGAALKRMLLRSGKTLAAVITESFGPCFWPDHPDVSWDWYKRYNADALRVVSALDFQGSSLSNYAEPIFSLWKDVDWHWSSNAFFCAAKG